MIFQRNRSLIFILPILGILSVGTTCGQSSVNDSLSLNAVISEVVQNHPLVKKAKEELTNADICPATGRHAGPWWIRDYRSWRSKVRPGA